MDDKEAVRAAKNFVLDLLSGEELTNLGLEEIEYNKSEDVWYVTLGFSRPRDTISDTTVNLAESRTYHEVKVRNSDACVISLSNLV